MQRQIDPTDLPNTPLDYHYYTLGRILFHLAEGGLSRVDFDQSDAFDVMDFRKGDEEDVLKVFCDVLIFMIKEDVIRAQNVQEYDGGYAFSGVQLTSKGLSLINAKAETSQISGSITETIKENSKAASSDTPYAKWGEFVGGLLGSLTNTLS